MKTLLILLSFMLSSVCVGAPSLAPAPNKPANPGDWRDSGAMFLAITYINEHCPQRLGAKEKVLADKVKQTEKEIRKEYEQGAPGLLSNLAKEMAPNLPNLCKKGP